MADVGDGTTGDELIWKQGSSLPKDVVIKPLHWVHPANAETRTGKGELTARSRRGKVTEPFQVEGPCKEGDRMMVITQTCDLTKLASVLPQFEVARVFATDKPQMIAQAQDFGSARYHRVNDSSELVALVLDYGHRALLEKGFLRAVSPDNSIVDGWDAEQAKLVARWLGQRYSRPAVPDDDYEQITRPVRDAWETLVAEEPDTAAEYNRDFAEWRYRRENDGSLTVFTLSSKREPNELIALEVRGFLTEALEPHFKGRLRFGDHLSYYTFTRADEISTDMIAMEKVSQDEAAVDAASPDELD
ncbi:MAG: hypothetical protein H0V26_11040 [Solirubrobacterales bacterium]|nr:hypothetical protein [Solirubrobacterales bacterium]